MPSSTPLPAALSTDDDHYEDLLGLWSDLEAGLHLVLTSPVLVPQFPAKIQQLETWMRDLVAHDTDAALYLMFQLASSSTVGYSASHALVCATLCQILATEFQLPLHERHSLVRAALTMNVGMTTLQDQLSLQRDRPSPTQQEAIDQHPHESRRMLEQLGVNDPLWLDIVTLHHAVPATQLPLLQQPAAERLARILATTDRYAAMISPRKSRPGRSVMDSALAVTQGASGVFDEAGHALVHCAGHYPPGVFVRLSSGETAIVLRRSPTPQAPLVAKVLTAEGFALRQPLLLHLQESELRISGALTHTEVSLRVNHFAMVQLGLYAARYSEGLQHLVQLPGTH